MAFDFPTSPAEGQVYSPAGGPKFVYYAPAWRQVTTEQKIQLATAETRNRVVNGAMQHSQENGDTVSAANAYYGADQWCAYFAGVTSNYSGRQGTVPDQGLYIGGVLSAGAANYVFVYQAIEGTRVSDLRWGTASARKIVVRFEAYSQLGGTFAFSVRNGDATRSYLAPFTLPTGVWTTITLSIPGDATGTWPTTTGVGMQIAFCFGCGTNLQGVAGWQAGNKIALASTTNGMTTSASCAFRNVGLYADPNNTGVAPPWQVPDYAEELQACQRYWERGNQRITYKSTYFAGVAAAYDTIPLLVQKRPGAAVSTTTFKYYNTSDALTLFTPSGITMTGDKAFYYFHSGMTNWKAWSTEGIWTVNARM